MSTPLQLNCTFQKEGYVVMRQVLSQQSIDQLRQQIQKTLHACAHELECTFEQYLSAVSRWVAPSPVLADIPQLLIERVFQSIEKILREPVSLQRINVISKNKYSFDKIPFHQDISYSREAPYQLSSWLALHDTHEKNGPLAVIPRSHFWPIEKAVDFWSPDYEPNLDREKHAVKLAIKAGDMILFDSRLWHGSSQNDSHEDRFAVVTRWSSKSWIPPTPIPPIEPLRFGMWTCGKMTENLLKKGLETILNDSKEEFLDVVENWIQFLQQGRVLPFLCDSEKALNALVKVKILHHASIKYSGGDGTGTIYKNLWEKFLCPLEKYLEQKKS